MEEVLTVSQLNAEIKDVIDLYLGNVVFYVEGEVQNPYLSQRGHLYFSLVDETSKIKVVLFRATLPQDWKSYLANKKCVVKGKVRYYAAKGEISLVAEELLIGDVGEFKLKYDAVKKRLYEEGWLPKSPRELPRFPYRIGIICAASGAAVQDFLRIGRKLGRKRIYIIWDTKVEGKGSVEGIKEGLRYFNEVSRVDVIAIVRGGGDKKELNTFNDYSLAIAILNSSVPVVTGIGHQIDFTIADLVADVSAATPTEASEIVHSVGFADTAEKFEETLRELERELLERINKTTKNSEELIRRWSSRLKWETLKVRGRPSSIVSAAKRLFAANLRMWKRKLLQKTKNSVKRAKETAAVPPLSARRRVEHLLTREKDALKWRESAFKNRLKHLLEEEKTRLSSRRKSLTVLNPENTLRRGFTWVRQGDKFVERADRLARGKFFLRFYDGEVEVVYGRDDEK